MRNYMNLCTTDEKALNISRNEPQIKIFSTFGDKKFNALFVICL